MSSFNLQKQQWDAQTPNMTCLKAGRATGKVFASGWDDRKVRVFALGVGKPVLELDGLDCNPVGLQFNGTEEVLAGGDEKGLVTMWSLKQGKVARTLEGGTKSATEIAFHPSGAFCAVAGHDLTTRVWDLRSKKCVQTYSAHERTTALSFSPGAGTWIVSGGDSGLSKVWDVRAGKIFTTLKKHTGAVTDIAFHNHELVMATGGEDGIVHFWNVNDFSRLSTAPALPSAVKGVTFASDASVAMAVSDNAFRSLSWAQPQATVLESQSSLAWGPVKDAFVRRDKLVVVSGAAHAASAWVLDLAPVLPKTENVENVAPPADMGKKDAAPVPADDTPAVQPPAPLAEAAAAPEPAQASAVATIAPATSDAVVVVVPPQQQQQQPVPPVQPVAEKPKKERSKPAQPQPQQAPAEERKKGSRVGSRPAGEEKKGGSQKQRKSEGAASQPAQQPPQQPSVVAAPVAQTSGGVVPGAVVGIVPSQREKALGLKAEEFRGRVRAVKSEQDALNMIMEDHANMCATLATRKAHVTAVRAMWTKESVGRAIVQMRDAKELSVAYDVLGSLNSNAWALVPLDSLHALLQEVQLLVQSEYEDYVVLGCSSLRHVHKAFGPSLKATRESKAADVRADAVLAERLEQSNACWETLGRSAQQLRENMACGGRIGSSAREVLALFRRIGL